MHARRYRNAAAGPLKRFARTERPLERCGRAVERAGIGHAGGKTWLSSGTHELQIVYNLQFGRYKRCMQQANETLQVLRSRSLSSVLQDEIEQRILSGALGPGERVNENALAEELGVSRGPIREACRGLVESGLLTIIVNRGVFVREVSLKEAVDVYNVRASLMRLAGETLAERITDDELAVLRDLVERMDEAEAADDFDSFNALNRDFHTRIVDYADNSRLRSISDGLVKELHLYRHRSILQGGGLHVSNREHKQILAALGARDPDRAGAAMEEHIKAGKQRFLAATARDTRAPDPRDS